MDRGMGDSHSMGMGGGMGMGNSGMGGPGNNMAGNYGNSGQGGGGMFGGGNAGGARRGDTIVVRNLAMDCNWHTLKDRFSHAGDIKFAEMKDRGIGIIRFGTERDAERAVSMMNQQRIDNRLCTVGLYL